MGRGNNLIRRILNLSDYPIIPTLYWSYDIARSMVLGKGFWDWDSFIKNSINFYLNFTGENSSYSGSDTCHLLLIRLHNERQLSKKILLISQSLRRGKVLSRTLQLLKSCNFTKKFLKPIKKEPSPTMHYT